MIVLTRLNKSRFAVNDDLVERMQESPDTTLFMVDGSSYIVTEPLADVIELIAHSRAHILALANHKGIALSAGDDTQLDANASTLPETGAK